MAEKFDLGDVEGVSESPMYEIHRAFGRSIMEDVNHTMAHERCGIDCAGYWKPPPSFFERLGMCYEKTHKRLRDWRQRLGHWIAGGCDWQEDDW